MRKIVIAAMSTISGLVLLFSYHTSTNSLAAPSTDGTETDSGSTGTTYTGDAVETVWGTVQVEITVQDGTITSADAIQYPDENHHDQEINEYAVPALNAAVAEAQSADIDTISGATVTSDGYRESLQSALDAANL